MKNKYFCFPSLKQLKGFSLLIITLIAFNVSSQNLLLDSSSDYSIVSENAELNEESEYQCEAELTVYKNRKFKSISDKAYYKLSLKNTSSRTNTYTINTENVEADCSNTTFKRARTASNVDLSATFSQNLRGSITLAAGETFDFQIIVKNPAPERNNGNWGCINVSAETQNCRTVSSVVLSLYATTDTEN